MELDWEEWKKGAGWNKEMKKAVKRKNMIIREWLPSTWGWMIASKNVFKGRKKRIKGGRENAKRFNANKGTGSFEIGWGGLAKKSL